MPESVPAIASPLTVTVLPVPTFLSANAAATPARFSVTTSPETMPFSAALPVFRVAVAVPS